MFAGKVTDTVQLDDNGVIVDVTVRKLNHRALREASESMQATAIRKSRDAGGELVKAFRDMRPAASDSPDIVALRTARYAAYDRDIVLTNGVMKWTSDVDLKGGLADLDEQSAEKLHEAILDLSLPPIDPVEAAAAGKGSSAASISS